MCEATNAIKMESGGINQVYEKKCLEGSVETRFTIAHQNVCKNNTGDKRGT